MALRPEAATGRLGHAVASLLSDRTSRRAKPVFCPGVGKTQFLNGGSRAIKIDTA